MVAFPTTRQSLIEDLRSNVASRRASARAKLAEQYWQPLYTYLRWRWRLDPDRAGETTQDLFLAELERDVFARFEPGRARFRTYLRACADNLVRDGARRRAAGKRGAGDTAVTLSAAETELARLDPQLSPEEAFDRAWRARIVQIATTRVDASLRKRGKTRHAEVLAAYYADDPPPSYRELAERLGLTLADVTNWLHIARRELKSQLSIVLREGGVTDAELREELRRLG